MSETSRRECLERFADAWARRDVGGLLELMTEDAVYSASVGPEPGRTFRGHAELADGFRAMFEHDAAAVVDQGEPLMNGEWAVRTWTYHLVADDGLPYCEYGIDLWRFRDGKICLKDAYRKTRLPLVLTPMPAAGHSAASPVSPRSYRSLLQERLDAIVEAGAVGVLAEVRHEGRTYRLSSGKAERGGQAPPAVDGRFRAWSITKTVTATGVLKLVADGRLSLEDTVETHLPGLLPDGGEVTVRNLLDHTSGVADYADDLPLTPQGLREMYPEPRELVASVAPRGLAFTPASRHAYSNTNYVLLGLIIEKVTGQPWRTYLTQQVIIPAGLEQTVLPGQNIAISGPHAHHYATFSGHREPQDITELNPAEAGAAGEMISTAADVNTLYAALLSGRLLPAELLEQMLEITDDRPYGLGIAGRKTSCAGLRYGHTGSFPGYRTQAWSSRRATTQVSMSLNLAGTDHLDEPVEEFIEAAFCP